MQLHRQRVPTLKQERLPGNWMSSSGSNKNDCPIWQIRLQAMALPSEQTFSTEQRQ